jgi:uncharacterized protein YlxW (UPF0749 family)
MVARWPQLGWLPVVALTALAFGFFFATQLRSQVIPQSDRVSRNQALVATVKHLESDNSAYRRRIEQLRSDINRLEAEASLRSDADRQLSDQVNELRAHAGLTKLRGPGVTVTLADGRPAGSGAGPYLVNAQDIQDVVNLLFQGGAEGVAVNGRRISPLSKIAGAGTAIVIDQGPPLAAPFRIVAIGNRSQMDALIGQPASLGDLKLRQRSSQLQLSWNAGPDLTLPAYDSSLVVRFAHAS